MFQSEKRTGFRAGGRGRSGYNAAGKGRGQGWRSKHEIQRVPSPPIGPILQQISRDELEGNNLTSREVGITGMEDVASYNWVDRENEPTIMVPGKYFRNWEL